MRHFKTSDTTLYFNTRDELIKIKVDKVAYFEADANYCNIILINGAKATVLASLLTIEELLNEKFKDDSPTFIRIGKRYIVNLRYIFQINIPRQRLVLSDSISPVVLEISVSKEALRNLKNLYTLNQ